MKEERDNIILQKSMDFAVRTVNLYKYLNKEKKEYILSKQVLRSGTSIGANCTEAVRGQSKADFVAKMNIALKEACETEYWIELLSKTEFLSKEQRDSLISDIKELIRLLTSIIKKTLENKE